MYMQAQGLILENATHDLLTRYKLREIDNYHPASKKRVPYVNVMLDILPLLITSSSLGMIMSVYVA